MKNCESANDVKHLGESAPIKGNVKGTVKKAIYNGAFAKYRGRECTVHYTANGQSRITLNGHSSSIYVPISKILTHKEYEKRRKQIEKGGVKIKEGKV